MPSAQLPRCMKPNWTVQRFWFPSFFPAAAFRARHHQSVEEDRRHEIVISISDPEGHRVDTDHRQWEDRGEASLLVDVPDHHQEVTAAVSGAGEVEVAEEVFAAVEMTTDTGPGVRYHVQDLAHPDEACRIHDQGREAHHQGVAGQEGATEGESHPRVEVVAVEEVQVTVPTVVTAEAGAGVEDAVLQGGRKSESEIILFTLYFRACRIELARQ